MGKKLSNVVKPEGMSPEEWQKTLRKQFAAREVLSVVPRGDEAAYGVFDGIVINPAAYTHTSVAILDALKAVAIPAVEVHISDVKSREDFRQISYAGKACIKTYMGLGFDGYVQAVKYLKDYLDR